MSRLPDHVIDDVRSRADIVEIISEHVQLQRSGRGFKGLCPFHSEKTPSFHVDRERQLFYCFGCQEGGNLFHFLMKVENAPFIDVVQRLAERFGIPIEQAAPSPGVAQRKAQRERLFRANEIAADFYVKTLYSAEGAEARRYLKGRGLTKEVVDRFKIGFAPSGWHRLRERLRESGVSEEDALRAGLLGAGRRGTYDWLRERVVFPVMDERGRIVGFGGRILAGEGAKYLNTSESPIFSKRKNLYGLHAAQEALRKTDRAVLVEGYMDVVSLYRHGFHGAVASLGTAFTEEQARLLKRRVSRVVIAYDADAAGRIAVMRGLEILANQGLEVRVAQLPEGDDPDSLIRRDGFEAFVKLIDASLPLVEYKLEEAISGCDLGQPDGRIQAVRNAAPILAAIDSPVAMESYVLHAASRIGVTARALAEELRRHQSGRERGGAPRHNLSRGRYTIRDSGAAREPRASRRRETRRGSADSNGDVAERDLLRWVIEDPSKAEEVARCLGEAPFHQFGLNQLFQWIRAQGDTSASGEVLLSKIDDPEVAQVAGSLIAHGQRPAGPFKVYLDRVNEDGMRRQLQGLEAKLSRLMNEERITPDDVGRLVGQYKEVRDRLHRTLGDHRAS